MIETYPALGPNGSHPNCVTAKVEQEEPAPFHEARNPSQRFFRSIIPPPTNLPVRSKLIGRVVDYLSFYAAAWRTLLEVTRPGDVLVAMTDPPLILLVALQVANRRRAYLVKLVTGYLS